MTTDSSPSYLVDTSPDPPPDPCRDVGIVIDSTVFSSDVGTAKVGTANTRAIPTINDLRRLFIEYGAEAITIELYSGFTVTYRRNANPF